MVRLRKRLGCVDGYDKRARASSAPIENKGIPFNVLYKSKTM